MRYREAARKLANLNNIGMSSELEVRVPLLLRIGGSVDSIH